MSITRSLSAPDYSLEYDHNGNPVQKYPPTESPSYTYDAWSRLTSITHPDSKKTFYLYDSFSRLIAEQSEGVQTLYLYDKTQEIGAMNAQGITQLKVVGLGLQGEIGGTIAIEIEGTALRASPRFSGKHYRAHLRRSKDRRVLSDRCLWQRKK